MTTPATHPATHTMNLQPYRRTERGIFRLSGTNEWVRSNVNPRDFRREATAKHTTTDDTKQQKESKPTREQRYLKKVEENAAELREYYTADTLPSPRTIQQRHGISEIAARRATLMIKEGATAKQARDKYKTAGTSPSKH